MKKNATRCDKCNGRKKIAPLGFIEKECPACKGIGYIAEENTVSDKKEAVKSIDKNPIMKTIKRRGRPPRKLIND